MSGRGGVGGQVQFGLTILKVAGIAVLGGGILFFSKGGMIANLARPAGVRTWTGFAAFGTAMLAALWAYEGWNQMPMCAGEVQNPTRNVPRGLIIGTAMVVVIYCLVNFSYFYALPFSEVVTSKSTTHR